MKALKLFAVILIAGQIAGCSAYKAAIYILTFKIIV